VILEYGSGGSTVLAATMPGKYVMSVESDRSWTRALRRKIALSNPQSQVVLHHVDIGPTGDWGRPLDDSSWRNFHRYPSEIWDCPFFRHPDVILIDGRFRTACLAVALLQAERPVTVLFDDYAERPRYHLVERIIGPIAQHDRMVEFRVEPGMVRPRDIGLLIEQFFQVTMHGVDHTAYDLPDMDPVQHAPLL
jgi:hypothetical protein